MVHEESQNTKVKILNTLRTGSPTPGCVVSGIGGCMRSSHIWADSLFHSVGLLDLKAGLV